MSSSILLIKKFSNRLNKYLISDLGLFQFSVEKAYKVKCLIFRFIDVLIIFSTGLILMSLGIVGIYIEKIFEQTKDRPLYLIDETINLN